MFQYAIEVLESRKREISSHFSDICEKNGGTFAVLEAQSQVLDIEDALSVLKGLRDDLKKDGLLENVEGDCEKESKLMAFDNESLRFDNENLRFEREEEFFE